MTSCMDFVQNNLKIIKQNLSSTKWSILIGRKKVQNSGQHWGSFLVFTSFTKAIPEEWLRSPYLKQLKLFMS